MENNFSKINHSLEAFENLFQLKSEFPVCPEYTSLKEKDKAFFVVYLLRFRENLKKTNMYSFTWYKDARKIRNHFAHITEVLGVSDFELIQEMYDKWLDQALDDLYLHCHRLNSSNVFIRKYAETYNSRKTLNPEKQVKNDEKTASLLYNSPNFSPNLIAKYSEFVIQKAQILQNSYKNSLKAFKKNKTAESYGVWTYAHTLSLIEHIYKEPKYRDNYDEYNPQTKLLDNVRLYSKVYDQRSAISYCGTEDNIHFYDIELPEGIFQIGPFAFDFDYLFQTEKNPHVRNVIKKISIKRIILPQSLISVSTGSFANLPGKTRITFGENLLSVSSLAFYNSLKAEVHFTLSQKLKIFEGAVNPFVPGTINHTALFYDGTDISNAINFESLLNHYPADSIPNYNLADTEELFKNLSPQDLEAYELLGNRIFLQEENYNLQNKEIWINDILLDCGHLADYVCFSGLNFIHFKKLIIQPLNQGPEKAVNKTGNWYLCSSENYCSIYFEEIFGSQKKHKIFFVRGHRERHTVTEAYGFEVLDGVPVKLTFVF